MRGLQVERLARRVGKTKGSFYWHFASQAEFHSAILDAWHDEAMSEAIAPPDESTPTERLRKLASLPFGDCLPRLSALEHAVRAWSITDANVRAKVMAVDNQRLLEIAELVAAAGEMSAEQARARAVIVYSYVRLARTLIDPADLSTIQACTAQLISVK